MGTARRGLLERSTDPTWRFRLKLGTLVLALLIAIVGFEEVVDDVFHDVPSGDLEAQQLDAAAAVWVRSIRSPMLTQVMTDLTALGSISVLVVVSLLILGTLGFTRNLFRTVHFLTVGIGAVLIPPMLKAYFARPRPDFADRLVSVGELSFPSGHSFGATSIYLFIAIWAWSWNLRAGARWAAGLSAMFLILCVGLSRIYLGVHYTTDVMAGIAAGATWTLLMAIVFLLLERKKMSGV